MNNAPFINPELAGLAVQPETLIVFPHAQRTGGKALRRVLERQFGAERIYVHNGPIVGSKSWQDITGKDLEGYRVFTGPDNYADLDKGRPTVFLGLLRHPLYRLVSIYGYCAKRPQHRFYSAASRLSLEGFYREAAREYPPYFLNTQCMRICGEANALKAQRLIAERYIAVGVKDDLVSLTNRLSAALEWPQFDLKPIAADAGVYGHVITPELRDAVLRDSAEDLKLYDWITAGTVPARPPLVAGLRSSLARLRTRI